MHSHNITMQSTKEKVEDESSNHVSMKESWRQHEWTSWLHPEWTSQHHPLKWCCAATINPHSKWRASPAGIWPQGHLLSALGSTSGIQTPTHWLPLTPTLPPCHRCRRPVLRTKSRVNLRPRAACLGGIAGVKVVTPVLTANGRKLGKKVCCLQWDVVLHHLLKQNVQQHF